MESLEYSSDDIFLRDKYAKIARGEVKHLFLAGIKFHKMMQDPAITEFVFEGSRPGLFTLCSYWSGESGKHLFGKTVTKLAIVNVPLVLDPKFYFPGETADYQQVAWLIAKNPDIREIVLTRTSLDDEAAEEILRALYHNHRLQELELDGNDISDDLLKKIAARVACNRPLRL